MADQATIRASVLSGRHRPPSTLVKMTRQQRARRAAELSALLQEITERGGKECTVCEKFRPIAEFSKDSTKKTGHRSVCRSCAGEARKRNYKANRESRLEYGRLYKRRPEVRQRIKVIIAANPQKFREYAKRWRAKPGTRQMVLDYTRRRIANESPEAKAVRYERQRLYRKTEKYRAWREATREHRREQARTQAARRRSSVSGTIHNRISRAVNSSLREGKNRKRTFEIIGYTAETLKTHIERQFTRGMTWDRFMAGEIEIDHIIPVATFKIRSAGDQEFMACWAIANLRPLWKPANQAKGAKRELLL